jgi:hypothetical protein
MRDYEQHIGRAIPVESKDETNEEMAKRVLAEKGKTELPSYHETYLEWFTDEFYKEYALVKGVLYKLEAEEVDPYDDVVWAKKNADGSINYVLRYYNGGCGFDEVFEEAILRLDK